MRIAMIGQKGMPATYGGVERHVHDLSIELVKAGHEVTVYSRFWYTKTKITEFEGVRVKLIPSIRTKHLDSITHVFFSTIHALFQNYDIIHFHGVGPALVSWMPRLFTRKTKVITTFHSIDRYHQKWNWIAKYFLRLGEWFACRVPHKSITVSLSLQKYCLNEFGAETKYIPNGAIIKKNITRDQSILDKFSLKTDNYFVMISRLVPHKGAHLLIEAFIKLKTENPADVRIQNLKLAIVGDSVHTDEYVARLRAQADARADIVFTGFQSDETLRQLYLNALAIIHPSLNEGLPGTVIEAMSYGKAALLSDIPEHIELVQDTRVIFQHNSVSDLTKKMLDFINLCDNERELIAERNQLTVSESYSWETLTPMIVATYEDMLANEWKK